MTRATITNKIDDAIVSEEDAYLAEIANTIREYMRIKVCPRRYCNSPVIDSGPTDPNRHKRCCCGWILYAPEIPQTKTLYDLNHAPGIHLERRKLTPEEASETREWHRRLETGDTSVSALARETGLCDSTIRQRMYQLSLKVPNNRNNAAISGEERSPLD